MAMALNDFLDLLSCSYTVHYNVFDASEHSVLKKENEMTIAESIFPMCGFIPGLLKEGLKDGPAFVSTVLGLYWIAVVDGDTKESLCVHVLGPIAEYPFHKDEAARLLNQYSENIPNGQTASVLRALMGIPVIPSMIADQYGLMFYYCLRGRKCTLSDIVYTEQSLRGTILDIAGIAAKQETEANSAYAACQFESELIQAVRNGDLNILISMYDDYMKLNTDACDFADPIRYVKDLSIIFLAYNTHASIEGGLSPETAYQLRRHYLHMIEQSRTILELTAINTTGFEDFITRVHQKRFADKALSLEILHCQEYIRLHIEENLSLARLAAHFHYTVYYFSRKFKEECKISITDYIKQQKTERAKLLLKTTQLSVKEISEKLSFESVNTFCTVFKKCTGMSPTAFRGSLL